jgi:RimJ/RimL family protein N-acetyltransferase
MPPPADNDTAVLAVLADRFRLPLDQLRPGRVLVAQAPGAKVPVRAFLRDGGAVVTVRPEHAALVGHRLDDPRTLRDALEAVARDLPGRVLTAVTRTGVRIPPPQVPIMVTTATDPRLPDWVQGHFTGPAWTVLGPDGEVLSTAVLKDYDDRLREISVGTAAAARGRGLARAVAAAAAQAVLDDDRAVLYMHDEDNEASARVAAAAGLTELGRLASIVPDRAPDRATDENG